MCGVDWTNIKINDNNENEDSTRRSRRSRKAVSYTNHHDVSRNWKNNFEVCMLNNDIV